MRIACPFCGTRDSHEFTYHGDATVSRPAGTDAAAFHAYAYIRANPAGPHRELWYHSGGCRSWLEVERDTRTHEINEVRFVAEAS